MARRRGEKKPELGFEVPDFDEQEFVRKETISFRTTFILFAYSILTAFVTFLAWALIAQSWYLALFVGMGLGAALRWMYPLLKVDISHWKRKEWIGTGFLYFFSWLAFLIFFVNPPLYDGVPPDIEVHVTPEVQFPDGAINITVIGLDNVAVDDESLSFEILDPDGTTIATTDDLVSEPHQGAWRFGGLFQTSQTGTYTIRVTLSDLGGGIIQPAPHTTTEEATFEIRDDALRVFLGGTQLGDRATRFTSPDNTVRVEIPDTLDVYRAFLQTDNDTRIHLEHDPDTDVDGRSVWRARADQEGWQAGNNTFTVHVQEHDSYWLSTRFGPTVGDHVAELASPDSYTVTIDDTAILGNVEPDLPSTRSAAPVQVPGPGIALVVGGVFMAAWWARRHHG